MFTGDERDGETNLDHTLFRKYSSNLGRWLTPDPAGLAAVDPSDPQSWNRYAYVENDPVDWLDPLGLCGQGGQARAPGPCSDGDAPYPCTYAGGGFCGGNGGGLDDGCYLNGAPASCSMVNGLLSNPSGATFPNFGPNWKFIGDRESIGGINCYSNQDPGQDQVVCLGYLPSGNTSGGSMLRPTPKLTFKPPSWHNFTHEFLPCYGGQLTANFLTGDGLVGTGATIALALTATKRWIGGPLLVLWTAVNAFKAGSACAVASRGHYQ